MRARFERIRVRFERIRVRSGFESRPRQCATPQGEDEGVGLGAEGRLSAETAAASPSGPESACGAARVRSRVSR